LINSMKGHESSNILHEMEISPRKRGLHDISETTRHVPRPSRARVVKNIQYV
jgi:hypothetical protein